MTTIPKPIWTAHSVCVGDLPAFTQVNSKWKKVFIPSLYDSLYMSSQPFQAFVSGSTTFIKIIQQLVNCVYPEVHYIISKDEPIHLLVSSHLMFVIFSIFSLCTIKAYNRVNEKRSRIGKDAIKIVETHLECIGLTDADDIKCWCRWAKRVDGPLFFKTPTPQSRPTDKNDAKYIVSPRFLTGAGW